MKDALLDRLLAQARTRSTCVSAEVRIAARMRMARVESVRDGAAARITLEMAVAEATDVKDGIARESLLDLGRRVAAAVAPEMVSSIPVGRNGGLRRFSAGQMVQIMLSHGHAEAAAAYVMEEQDGQGIPFGFVGNVLAETSVPERRTALLRKAVAMWRTAPAWEFEWVFRAHWRELPEEEAREVLRELVDRALGEPDTPMQGTFDEGRVVFTSKREHTLFELLSVLRRLAPTWAEVLVERFGELRAAAARYPAGWDTILEEDERRRRAMEASGAVCEGDYLFAGNPSDRPYALALHDAMRGQVGFEVALSEARAKYGEDADPDAPNAAPKEFWPSTARYRNALFAAGKTLGEEAEPLLTEIPDREVRLLASVELAAALAGLPELPSIQREYRPGMRRGERGWEPRWPAERYAAEGREIFGAVVRCPGCNWLPAEEDRWACKCGHRWNTFETRGKCPGCGYQWTVTACWGCHRAFPHGDWYVGGSE